MTSCEAPVLIGQSAAIRAVRAEVSRVARSRATVLITGESGVGKEVVAQLIHSHCPDRARIVAVNCAGVAESLLEAELFGHVRGSFTGAYRDRPGLFELANHGTVFLDEVGEMSPRMQGAMLRFLETRELQRVGSEAAVVAVDVRVIAATNRNLADAVAKGAFRRDLFYRLNVLSIHMPPLRERTEDVPVLIEHFLHITALEYRMPRPAISSAGLAAMTHYSWPGNIRELKNVIERLVVQCNGSEILVDNLPPDIVCRTAPAAIATVPQSDAVDIMFSAMVERGASFWSAAYEPFLDHDVTRRDLRALVDRGLRRTAGNYRDLLRLFNLEESDYKRFLSCLRKHECLVSFKAVRAEVRAAAILPQAAVSAEASESVA